jgi:hypothetical protein
MFIDTFCLWTCSQPYGGFAYFHSGTKSQPDGDDRLVSPYGHSD